MPTETPHAATDLRRRGSRVYVRPPRGSDSRAFLAAVAASRALHRGWVEPPSTSAHFGAYLARFVPARLPSATHVGLLAFRAADDALVGVFNFSEIVHGSFESAYLGYYGFAPLAGRGYMREGLALALVYAFRTLRLHRVEVNIQPPNERSIALVRAAGFTHEGFSRRYLKIAGRWRDHERWAMLAEDWSRARRRAS
jgi:ribosomal-protein-alanine N-acetyltransferase